MKLTVKIWLDDDGACTDEPLLSQTKDFNEIEAQAKEVRASGKGDVEAFLMENACSEAAGLVADVGRQAGSDQAARDEEIAALQAKMA